MKPFKPKSVNEIKPGDMIAFTVTAEDGSQKEYLGFVNRRLTNDGAPNSPITGFNVLPMVEIEKFPLPDQMHLIEITDDETLRKSGLDTPHIICAFGVNLNIADHFPNGDVEYLGYIYKGLTNTIFHQADKARETSAQYFNLPPQFLTKISNFPILDRTAGYEAYNTPKFNKQSKKTATPPTTAWDVEGKELLNQSSDPFTYGKIDNSPLPS